MTIKYLQRNQSRMETNIRAVFNDASIGARRDGAQWYPNARRIMREWSTHYGHSVDTCACVTAALSPQCDWNRNLVIADDVLAFRAPSIGGALNANITKAQYIRDNGIGLAGMFGVFPCGPKVNSFAANLAGDDGVVTIDAHAVQAALLDPSFSAGIRWKPYGEVCKAYIRVACELDIAPTELQAIVWCAWRELWPRESKKAYMRKRVTKYRR